MVAKDHDSTLSEIANEAQRLEGGGAAIHDIADKPESVARAGKADLAQQLLQRREAALQIADGVGGQGRRRRQVRPLPATKSAAPGCAR